MLSSLPIPHALRTKVEGRRAVAALMKDLGEQVGAAARDPANQADLVERRCPLCPDGAAVDDIATVRGPVYDFHRCQGCSILFARRVLRPEVTRKLARERPGCRNAWRSYWEHMRADAEAMRGRQVYGALVDRLVAKAPGREAVIDVGCGFGKLLSELAPRFGTALGLELNRRSAQAGQEMFGVTIESRDLDKVAMAHGSVDLIVMNQILEHLTDVRSVLASAHALLKPGGVLWIGIPHGESLGMRVLGGAHAFVSTHMHVNMFTEPSLRRLGESAGFRVAAIGTDDAVDVSAADQVIQRLPAGMASLLLTVPALALDKVVRNVAARAGLPSRFGVGAHLEATLIKETV